MDWTGYEFYYAKDHLGQDTEDAVKMIEPDGTIRFVPSDQANKDWQLYQQWLADGNTTQSE